MTGNIVRNFLALLSVALAATVPGGAQTRPTVESRLSVADIRIGEQTVLTTTVCVDKKQVVRFPEYAANDTIMQGLEVVKCGEIDTTRIDNGQRIRLQRDYILTSFDSTLYSIPPMEVAIDGKPFRARTGLGLKVSSVPVDTIHTNQFNPPYDITESPYAWEGTLLWQSLAAWLLAGLLAAVGIRLSEKKPATRRITIKPPVPPFKKAAAALEKISSLHITDAEGNKQYFVALTEAIRVYLHERFAFNAMEKTTAEITEGMAELTTPEGVGKLKELFQTADFVKFAKQDATPDERKRCMETATNFLKETRDEAMENPKPIVQTVTLDERKQQWIRIGLWCALAGTLIACLAWTGRTAWNIYDIYL